MTDALSGLEAWKKIISKFIKSVKFYNVCYKQAETLIIKPRSPY